MSICRSILLLSVLLCYCTGCAGRVSRIVVQPGKNPTESLRRAQSACETIASKHGLEARPADPTEPEAKEFATPVKFRKGPNAPQYTNPEIFISQNPNTREVFITVFGGKFQFRQPVASELVELLRQDFPEDAVRMAGTASVSQKTEDVRLR